MTPGSTGYRRNGRRLTARGGRWTGAAGCIDRAGLGELLYPEEKVIPVIPAEGDETSAKLLPPIRARDIPKGERYGVLEVECY